MPFFSSGKKDFIIIALLLVSALVFWGVYTLFHSAGKPEAIYAEIIYEGELAEKVYLDKDRVFSIEKLPNVTFEIKDKKIAFIQSDCPDKVCVNTGRLDAGGQTAACLPNKALLRVVDDEGMGVDTVAR